jgi:hypothetical protein
VEVGAAHGDYYIEVDLHVVGHTFFDREGLARCARVPTGDFGPRQVDACEDEGYGPDRRVAPLDEVCLFGFGYQLVRLGFYSKFSLTLPIHATYEKRRNSTLRPPSRVQMHLHHAHAPRSRSF